MITYADTNSHYYAYDLDGKQYYFVINLDSLQGSAQVATEIYCGKLFLLFKYYVCRVYSYLPAGLVPGWFKIHSERELHIKMELH